MPAPPPASPPGPPPFTREFAAVLRYELGQVAERRRAVLGIPPDDVPAGDDVRFQAQMMNLTGLAFSGGGIRSGTVNLGVLQALASLGMLTRLDYLSTVSGGGYVGGWLAGWIRRETDAARELAPAGTGDGEVGRSAVANVQHQLDPSRLAEAKAERSFPGPVREQYRVVDEEPEPVRHLRSYSRYLTPRAGPFSLDTWAVFSIYVRNLTITLLTILPVVASVILFFRLLILPYQLGRPGAFLPIEVWVGVAFSPLVLAYVRVGKSLRRVRSELTYRTENNRKVWPIPEPAGSRWWDRLLIALCLIFSAVLVLYLFGRDPDGSLPARTLQSRVRYTEPSDSALEWYVVPALAAVFLLGVSIFLWVRRCRLLDAARPLNPAGPDPSVPFHWSAFGYAVLWSVGMVVLLTPLLSPGYGGEAVGPWGRAALLCALMCAGTRSRGK